MTDANGRHRRFNVELLGIAREQYLGIAARAEVAGAGAAVRAAMRAIWSRLEHDPRGFGEPLYDLRKMRMQVLRGTVPPLYVEYGVHDDTPLVVIRRIVWLADRP